jgi:hypothetical protein
VIQSGSAERFETLNFGVNIIGLKVKMHTLFRGLLIVGLLEKYPYLRVWKAEPAIDLPTLFRQRLLDGVECCGPE